MTTRPLTLILLSSILMMGCGAKHTFKGTATTIQGSGSAPAPTPAPGGGSPSPSYSQPTAADCSTPQYALHTYSNNSAPLNFYFGIYQVWGGTMNVHISGNYAADSVNLYLQAYDSTRWNITGNVAAVRSVKVTGYHSAFVLGVPSYKA
ncbi:MAG: hypothetical protein V4692_12495, partial [Bdellovibrionota bacterium]